MDAAQRILRYLKSAPGQGLFFPSTNSLYLTAYCDADWGGCQTTRRSTTGYVITLGGVPISWRTKKQQVVARSSAEAEYRAMAHTVSKVLWLRWLLQELGVSIHGATPLYCDNQAALHIAANPVFHERTKHVEMDCYFVRERVQSGDIKPLKVSSHLQLADMFTKGLGAERFHFLLSKLHVRNLHAAACGGVLGSSPKHQSTGPMRKPTSAAVIESTSNSCGFFTCPHCVTLDACDEGYICAVRPSAKSQH
ncbi:unnamed protein product [Linum trigynum]|uniref:Uncharacterized protein n=1 Tax=Linum trigynum TaxID=586398 RepID=A0AAV2D4H3_9ROSI